MQEAITSIETHYGVLHGVIHGVGDMGIDTFQTIQDTEETEGIRGFADKMRALYVLETVLADRQLDFCLLVSSLASVLGGLGQAAYTAANLFMDAFAANQKGRWLSINWDAWHFEAEQQHITALTPQLAKFAISTAEGIEVFQHILSTCTGHQVIVSTGDLPARMKRWVPESQQNQDRMEKKLKKHSRPHLSTPYVSPDTELERMIADIWQETLGIEKVGIDDNFFDLGGDSLIAVNAITQLEQMLQKKVPTANLYQTPHIRGLAGLLSQDDVQATQQRSKALDERSAKLSQRNLILQQRQKK
jgi:acyl carrier protein